MTSSTRLIVSLLALLALLACSSCNGCRSQRDDEPRVPFKLDTLRTAHRDAGSAQTPAQPPTDEQGSASYTPPIDHPKVDGGELPLTIVRATLAFDLDADGDRDALALVDDADKRMRMFVSAREANGFAEPREVTAFTPPGDASCEVSVARLDALSSTKAYATVTLACGEPKAPRPPAYVLFSLEPSPRVYERIELATPRADGETLKLAPESRDVDEDGHDDVVFLATVSDAAGASTDALSLGWLDRPSGLVRDVREPEATLAAWASAAEKLAPKSPDEALARAAAVTRMRHALCREGHAPLIVVAGTQGIACGATPSAAQAALVQLASHAKKGRVREAFDAYRALVSGELKPAARMLTAADTALRTLPAAKNVSLREGPAIERSRVPAAHLPRARFVSDDVLFVRRRAPITVALAEGTESAATEPSDDLIRDPSGQLAVTGIERSCAGYVLRVERAQPAGSEYAPSPPVSLPLVFPAEASPGCTSLPEAQRRDDGGFRVLGWAPQGVLAARGAERYVVPLTLDGKPAGEPRSLAPDAPAPAPLPQGSATSDGSRYVEATPFGVLVYQGASTELWRPDGYADVAARVSEAAISPSGRKVAIVTEDRVYVLTRSPSAP